MRRPIRNLLRAALCGGVSLGLLAAAPAWGAHTGGSVPLLDHKGNVIPAGSSEPYSPRYTCGGCHNYDAISESYHSQQGWDELLPAGDKTEKPWIQGPGMAGKW